MLAYVRAGEAKGTYLAAAPDFLPKKLALGSAAQVLWSPDGQRLALFCSEPEGYHLRLVDPSGNTLDEVDLGYYSIVMNGWLDNERLSIIRHRGTEAEELLEVHISEHKIYPLVTWEDEGRKLTMVGTDFHWSPDRKSLVIERRFISVVDAIQWEATDLGEFMEGPYQEFESWAPDSTQFLYEQWGKPNFPLLEAKPSLYLWDLAQGEGRWLLPNVWGAAWSPQGDQIAFLLLGNPQRDEQDRIRDTDFVPGQRCALPGERCALYVGVMDPSTQEVKALASLGQAISMQVLLGYPFFFGGYRPVWSPDGELLAYWDANGNLWIMRADGTGQRQLTQGLEVKEVAWSPDGCMLAIATANRLLIIQRPAIE
jgi:Tol biopolymer transport system component